MKKVLLTAIALLTIASASAFGMYGRGDSWIDFLTHGNQLRARMDQFGFVLGNGTIKGTVGFRANAINGNNWGNILTDGGDDTRLNSTVSAGIGYTSEMFGIGLGYNFTYVEKDIYVHTPVLTMNFLNNNLRLSVPIQVSVYEKKDQISVNIDDPNFGAFNIDGTQNHVGIAFDNIQLRYYTGIDAFNQIRFMVYYKNATSTINGNINFGVQELSIKDLVATSETLGFQLRLYFLNTPVGNVTINPFVRMEYHIALQGDQIKGYKAEDLTQDNGLLKKYSINVGTVGTSEEKKQSDIYDVYPYQFYITPSLGITANSDIVSLYVEPSLGYTVSGSTLKGQKGTTTHKLAWGAYAELYVRPVQDLEWYFEMNVNNSGLSYGTIEPLNIPVYFETTTGLTWYLPALGQ